MTNAKITIYCKLITHKPFFNL